MTEFMHTMIDIDENGEINVLGNKNIYNIDGASGMKKWIAQPISTMKLVKVNKPELSSGLKVCESKYNNTIAENAIGNYMNVGNNVYGNTQSVAMYSSCDTSNHNGLSILPENFTRVCCAFSSRRLIDNTWVNHFDEYLAPNESHEQFNEFVLDSVIYSLFESKSQQSSLRNIMYKGKKDWNIKNEFFWMSKDEIMELAEQYGYAECEEDARLDEDRFVYKFIKEHRGEFSKEAISVLEKAEELVRKSFQMRSTWGDDHEEYQLHNWDCGYYQLSDMWNEYYKEDFNEFRSLYKNLADKMRPMVYNLGFLRN